MIVIRLRSVETFDHLFPAFRVVPMLTSPTWNRLPASFQHYARFDRLNSRFLRAKRGFPRAFEHLSKCGTLTLVKRPLVNRLEFPSRTNRPYRNFVRIRETDFQGRRSPYPFFHSQLCLSLKRCSFSRLFAAALSSTIVGIHARSPFLSNDQ